MISRCLRFVFVLTVCALPACSRPADSAYEAGPDARRYPLSGVVERADVEGRQLTIAHETIPDFMDAMTMPFTVKETWAVQVAQPGDRVSATLIVDGARSWIEGVSLSKPPAGSTTGGTASLAGDVGIGPERGTPLPSSTLRDQQGRVVSARDFEGREVILTFIYTRCPLPDFCPLMMRRLNEAASRLRKAGRREQVQMVAITIDPARDTPEVLDAYGRAHITGEEGDPFAHWSLLVGTPEVTGEWARLFGLTYEPDGAEITHGLRTAVVDREGKVVGVLRGNQWSTDELMALLADARP